MGRYRIAVLPGDGIGPEVTDVALRVLRAAGGPQLDFTEHAFGAARYRETGEALPARVLDDCLKADAVFLAAIGLPDVRLPDNTEIQPVMMVGLRRALGLYAAVRPIKLYPGAPTALKDVGKGIDPCDHVTAGLQALDGLITDRTAWLIANHMLALEYKAGTLGHRQRTRLESSDDFDDLMLLRDLDSRGRVPGAHVGTVDEAIQFLKDLERSNRGK